MEQDLSDSDSEEGDDIEAVPCMMQINMARDELIGWHTTELSSIVLREDCLVFIFPNGKILEVQGASPVVRSPYRISSRGHCPEVRIADDVLRVLRIKAVNIRNPQDPLQDTRNPEWKWRKDEHWTLSTKLPKESAVVAMIRLVVVVRLTKSAQCPLPIRFEDYKTEKTVMVDSRHTYTYGQGFQKAFGTRRDHEYELTTPQTVLTVRVERYYSDAGGYASSYVLGIFGG
ncbi:hypothetical protein Tco_1142384 [Tanacetum coccineum]